MKLPRQDRCDHLQVDLRSRLPDFGDDGGTVLREIVVQSEDEFLIQLVAAADRPARWVAGLAGLPLRSRWFGTGHAFTLVPVYRTQFKIKERSVNVNGLGSGSHSYVGAATRVYVGAATWGAGSCQRSKRWL